MNGLVITVDNSTYFPTYKINGPMTGQEAALFTKEAYLVILLCDGKEAKADKDEYERFLSCLSNSPLECRKENQIKTMEYVLGTLLSEMLPISRFAQPTKIKYEDAYAPITETNQVN